MAGGWSAGFVQGGTKDAHVPVLGRWLPLDSGVLGWGVSVAVFQVCVGPGCRAGSGHPHSCPPQATRLWRSTVYSVSVLGRKWGGAAGSRVGPGPGP